MGDCLTITEANDFLVGDQDRFQGSIAKSLAINSPWINVFETKTFPAGVSDTQKSAVQEAVAPVISQVQPNWSPWACQKPLNEVASGTTVYEYTPMVYKERGPKICVVDPFSALEMALTRMETSFKDHVATLWNSWLRYQAFYNSATKIVADSTKTDFDDLLANGFQTGFKVGATPDSPPSFTFLKYIMNYVVHSLLAGPEFQFGNGAEKYCKFISDQDTIDALRREADVRSDLRYVAAGGFDKDGKRALTTYSWEGPYQGIAFGVDQSVMRASAYDPDTATATFVEPFTSMAASSGTKRVVNPDWLSAPYQVSFLIFRDSFYRMIPEEYLGEGLTKYFPQFWGGRVRWHNQKDNDCNIDGDTGFHHWTLASAFRPERPEFVIPIIHTRCVANLGLTSCTAQGYSSESL